jgi:YVTN family beta-propeller protein
MKKFPCLVFLAILLVSCTKKDNTPAETYLSGNGVFVVNEGNFMGGNGSLSFYSYDSLKIYNDLFANVNGRPLGDVPNAAEILGDKMYIVVNNSGKIEVVRLSDMKSVTTITGLISPRNIAFINSSKAYVTSMYSDSVIVLNLKTSAISGYINIRRSSESIVTAGQKAFVSSWVGGHEVMVIDTDTDAVTDSIQVGVEPESMALDKNNILWVLCNGGWMRENFAELDGINISDNSIEKHLVFPTIEESPSCLRIDAKRETLYYLDSGVRKLGISAATLPDSPFIPQTDHFFYKLGIDPVSNDILATDAVDYQQKGYLLRYDQTGSLKASALADIIPGYLCFKVVSE